MPTLESEILAKMSHSYYVHFVEYSWTRKNVTQLVPKFIVWHKMYKGSCVWVGLYVCFCAPCVAQKHLFRGYLFPSYEFKVLYNYIIY